MYFLDVYFEIKFLDELCENCLYGICLNTTVILDNGIKLTNLMICDEIYPQIDTPCSTNARPTVIGFFHL